MKIFSFNIKYFHCFYGYFLLVLVIKEILLGRKKEKGFCKYKVVLPVYSE